MDHCLIFAATNFWSDPASYLAILKVLIGLGAVIFVHELGHFLLAKACGVKCEKFYVGFDVPIKLFGQTIIPAKLISFQWGETEYGIGAIPLGGYVKMLGQDDNPGNIEEQIKESMVEGENTDDAILASGMIDQSKLDPRSYLAKSVIQRMLIISAGVVFNLIFAVLFAAIAFRYGVDYQPPVLGTVVGGGPAWEQGMAGAEITKVGDKKVEGYFPYMSFAEAVILSSGDSPIPIEFIPNGQTEAITAELKPKTGLSRDTPNLARIGAQFALAPIVGAGGAIEGSPAFDAKPPLEPEDRVVAVNGTSVASEVDLRHVLFRDANKPAVFTLERDSGDGKNATTETVNSTIGTNPAFEVGIGTKLGPVAAIKVNSPADKAGLEVGDEIISADGQPIGNLMTLDQRMVNAAVNEKPVTLEVKRDDQTIEISLQPIIPDVFSTIGPNQPVAVDTWGVALPMELSITSVEDDSPAAAAGVQVGDQLVSIEYLLTDEQKKDVRYAGLAKAPVVNFVEDKTSWAEVHQLLQRVAANFEFKLTVLRDEKPQSMTMKTKVSDRFFKPTRGFELDRLEAHYESDSWSDAINNGAGQVVTDLKRVGKTLKTLVTGKISATNLGGPGTIAMVATSEAAQSTSRLLLFLTFLSANLAIINFLPIPVLDGGHMMFLAYEGIFRRPVNERVQLILTYGGLAFVLCLMVFVISMDVGRISQWFM